MKKRVLLSLLLFSVALLFASEAFSQMFFVQEPSGGYSIYGRVPLSTGPDYTRPPAPPPVSRLPEGTVPEAGNTMIATSGTGVAGSTVQTTGTGTMGAPALPSVPTPYSAIGPRAGYGRGPLQPPELSPAGPTGTGLSGTTRPSSAGATQGTVGTRPVERDREPVGSVAPFGR